LDTTFQNHLALYRTRIFRAAVGYLGNEQDAKEATQETLLKAYNARERYDQSRPFYPWLYRIMKNTCLDAMSRRKYRAASGLDEERIAINTPSPLDKLGQRQEVDRVRAAMNNLNGEQQEIINLRHFQDLTYAEIAEILEIAEGTVMSRLYRARKALVKVLEETP
jgi:RNA polymerase sigma-70 factor (ECF subfamily)